MAYVENTAIKLSAYKELATRTKSAIGAAVAALPVEMFLDAVNTRFVDSFAFSAATYPGATDPSLNGKPVLVLVVKGVDNADPTNASKQTTTYSFLDMSKLVDTYTAKAGTSASILNISGYEIEVKIDPSTDNALSVTANGLMVDVTRKVDKVSNATAGNIPTLNAEGGIVDSGIRFATDAEVTEVLNEVFGVPANS